MKNLKVIPSLFGSFFEIYENCKAECCYHGFILCDTNILLSMSMGLSYSCIYNKLGLPYQFFSCTLYIVIQPRSQLANLDWSLLYDILNNVELFLISAGSYGSTCHTLCKCECTLYLRV